MRFRIENSNKNSYYRFEYLDVPFLVQYEGKKAIRGFGFVGFSPKILISSSFYDDSKSVTYGGSSQFNTVMMMGHIGGGVLFERPKWIYTVDARFSTSITNLASGSRTEYINFDKARTFVFGISLGAGYKFSKKKNNTPSDAGASATKAAPSRFLPPPAGACATVSTRLFHAPHEGHLPSQRALAAPHSLQA